MRKVLFILIVIAAFAALVMPVSAIIQIFQLPDTDPVLGPNPFRSSVQFYPGSNTQGYAVVVERYQPNGNFWGFGGFGPELPAGNFPGPFNAIGNDNGPFTYRVLTTGAYAHVLGDWVWQFGTGVPPDYINMWYPPEEPVEYQLEDGYATYIYINPAPDPYWYIDQCMGDYDLMTIGPDCWWP